MKDEKGEREKEYSQNRKRQLSKSNYPFVQRLSLGMAHRGGKENVIGI